MSYTFREAVNVCQLMFVCMYVDYARDHAFVCLSKENGRIKIDDENGFTGLFLKEIDAFTCSSRKLKLKFKILNFKFLSKKNSKKSSLSRKYVSKDVIKNDRHECHVVEAIGL